MLLDYYDIEDGFDSKKLERGKRYWRQGRVLDLTIVDEGGRVTCVVEGSIQEPYAVSIDIHTTAKGLVINGQCSCAIGYNCKHVVASLFAALEQTQKGKLNLQALWPAPENQHDNDLSRWFGALDLIEHPPLESANANNDEPRCLLYLLSWQQNTTQPSPLLLLQSVRRLKTGGYGKSSDFYIESSSALQHSPANYLLAEDIEVLTTLLMQKTAHEADSTEFTLHAQKDLSLIRKLVATGRCHWQNKDSKALGWGRTRPSTLHWHIDEQGVQRPQLAVSPPAKVIVSATSLWYLDTVRLRCGSVTCPLDQPVLGAILQAPPIAPEQVAAAQTRLRNAAPHLALPQTLKLSKLSAIVPTPVLNLKPYDRTNNLSSWFTYEHHLVSTAELCFDYQDTLVHPGNSQLTIHNYQNKQLISFTRDLVAERDAIEQLRKLGLNVFVQAVKDSTTQQGLVLSFGVDKEEDLWIDFLLEQVPSLRDQGWQVNIADDFNIKIAHIENWYVDIEEQDDNKWFDLELGIRVDGQMHNLLPLLVNWLQQLPKGLSSLNLDQLPADHKLIIPLPDGRLLPLPKSRVKSILDILVELFDRDALGSSGKLRMTKWRAADLLRLQAAMDASRTRWFGDKRLNELGERLRDLSGIQTIKPPKIFHGELRPYQQEGLNWLQFLKKYDLGGILADDMGLGKTVQSLAHLAFEKSTGCMDRPSLIVAPTSLMFNWQQEAARFVPSLKVLCLHGPERKQKFNLINTHDLVLTTYALLFRDEKHLLQHDYHYLILDEAQFIKNAKSKTKQIAQQLKARHRLCLTGTPMENHLGEIWSLFDFLMPGLLHQEKQFRRLFRIPIEKNGDSERQTRLHQRIAPFLLRRLKDRVEKDLPPKTEIIRVAVFSSSQQDLYETIRLATHEKVRKVIRNKGLNRSHIEILEALLKLRQVCCDPRLVKMAAANKVKASAKLELLMEMLPALLEEGRRILLFSQFTSMLKLIEQELHSRHIDYAKLTGQTVNRGKQIMRFSNGEVPLFLISLKAGGTGLNLVTADTVIHYDPWWNPAVENQATDRAHRIGQDKPVFVYKLLTEGTVEQRITAMQDRKRALAEGILQNKNNLIKSFSQQDLEDLFAPL